MLMSSHLRPKPLQRSIQPNRLRNPHWLFLKEHIFRSLNNKKAGMQILWVTPLASVIALQTLNASNAESTQNVYFKSSWNQRRVVSHDDGLSSNKRSNSAALPHAQASAPSWKMFNAAFSMLYTPSMHMTAASRRAGRSPPRRSSD